MYDDHASANWIGHLVIDRSRNLNAAGATLVVQIPPAAILVRHN